MKKEKDYEEYLLEHNPKRVATMFCNDCGEVVRMDRLEFHNCPKEKKEKDFEQEREFIKLDKKDMNLLKDILNQQSAMDLVKLMLENRC